SVMKQLLQSRFAQLLLFVFILGSIHISPRMLYAQAPAVKKDTAVPGKYKEQLKKVKDYCSKLGFNITPYINDRHFEIYETLDRRFVNSAEKTSFTLQEYKKILRFKEKAKMITHFVDVNRQTLQKAEQKYGIDKFVIAAILGVESDFGKNTGHHNPFNVYVSMIVLDYRADCARAQLKHLLQFAKREQIDVMQLKSSYAGAMGYAQFIPYSLNKWWVGDRLDSMENNIKSIANYLAYFKKRTHDKIGRASCRERAQM